jgi:HEAT repeat protein
MLWWTLYLLKSEDPELRFRAVSRLKKRKEPKAIGALIGALSDDDWRVRRDAFEALEEADPAWKHCELALEAVQRLIGLLSSGSKGEAIVAASALAYIADDRAILPLALKLTEPLAEEGTQGDSEFWVECLRRIDARWDELETTKAVIGRLFEMMRSANASDRVHAAHVLSQIPCAETEGAMFHALHDPDPSVRVTAIWYLQRLGSTYQRAVFEALDDADPSVWQAAVEVISLERVKRWAPEKEDQRLKFVRRRYEAHENRSKALELAQCFFCDTRLPLTVQPRVWEYALSPQDERAESRGRRHYDGKVCYHCLLVGCHGCFGAKTCRECGGETEKASGDTLEILRQMYWNLRRPAGPALS